VAVLTFWGNGNKNNVDAFRNEEYGKEEEREVSEEPEEEKKENRRWRKKRKRKRIGTMA
jgi:hypothetical protein